MRYRGYRVDIIIAIALLTVLALLGIQNIYRQTMVEAPLSKALQALPGVRAVTINRNSAGYNITLNLLAVKSLPAVHRQAIQITKERLGSTPFSLELTDNRTPDLEELYWRMQVYIEEAIMQGNFGAAAAKLHQLATSAGAQTQFYVDKDYLYLEIYQDTSYLYAVRGRIAPHEEVTVL